MSKQKNKKYNKKQSSQNPKLKNRRKNTKRASRKKSGLDKEFVATYPELANMPILNWLFQAMYKEGWWYSIGMLVVGAIFLGFGLHHLGNFLITDEPIWLYKRIPAYWDAWFTGDLVKTRVSPNPGTLHSIFSGITTLFIDPKSYPPSEFHSFLFWWRLPIVLFNFIALFLIYHFLKLLTNKDQALLTTGLIATTPIILGMSQIVNSDSLLWSTSFISILTFFLYLRTDEKKYVIYSGISFGLALLCKYNAQAFYISYFLIWYLAEDSGDF